MMLKLSIRTKCKEGKVPLYTKMKINGVSLWVNLQLVVDIEKWNEISVSEKKQSNFLDRMGYTKKISEIEFGIKDLRARHRLTKESLDDVIRTVVFSEIREQYIKDEELEKTLEEHKRKDVKTFIQSYVDGIIKGDILSTKGTKYAYNTVRNWKQFRRIFVECFKNQSFTWDELSQHHIHTFLNHLDKLGYMGETRLRYIGAFSTLITISEKMKLHNNGIVRKWLATPTVTDDDRKARIYLTKEELKSLYELPLTGLKETIRDWFLIGCYTSLRYDELSKIEKGCIDHTLKGNKVIRIRQGKVNSRVVIPIMCDELEILLEKYNYTAPKLSAPVMNRYIKDICRTLSETVPTLNVKVRTKLSKPEREAEGKGRMKFEYDESGYVIKSRWELVACHSVRRTCLTNMYLSGKYKIWQMMSVSGHKKEETFLRYIRLSLDEKADDIADTASDGIF